MSTVRFIAASGLALLFGFAHAQNSSTTASTAAQPPLTQGISSVEKNLKKNPDNKGLQTASERLKENQERLEEAQRADRPSRPEIAQRPEKIDRPQRPGR